MVAYRGKAFAFNATAGLYTDVPVPAAAVVGDRLIVVAGSIGNSATVTFPAGWNNIAEFAPTSYLRTVVGTRTCEASDPGATFRWTWSTSARNFGYCLAYSGVDASVPTAAQPVVAQQDTPAPVSSAALGLSAGDWLLTCAVGRENPGTDTAKDWANSDTSDAERFDLYTANPLPSIRLTAALWDSNRDLPAGSTSRVITPSPLIHLIHVWSIRVATAETAPPPTSVTNPWSHMGLPLR